MRSGSPLRTSGSLPSVVRKRTSPPFSLVMVRGLSSLSVLTTSPSVMTISMGTPSPPLGLMTIVFSTAAWPLAAASAFLAFSAALAFSCSLAFSWGTAFSACVEATAVP